jgi:hypothetical protein
MGHTLNRALPSSRCASASALAYTNEGRGGPVSQSTTPKIARRVKFFSRMIVTSRPLHSLMYSLTHTPNEPECRAEQSKMHCLYRERTQAAAITHLHYASSRRSGSRMGTLGRLLCVEYIFTPLLVTAQCSAGTGYNLKYQFQGPASPDSVLHMMACRRWLIGAAAVTTSIRTSVRAASSGPSRKTILGECWESKKRVIRCSKLCACGSSDFPARHPLTHQSLYFGVELQSEMIWGSANPCCKWDPMNQTRSWLCCMDWETLPEVGSLSLTC